VYAPFGSTHSIGWYEPALGTPRNRVSTAADAGWIAMSSEATPQVFGPQPRSV
jgi:hypothetical protein